MNQIDVQSQNHWGHPRSNLDCSLTTQNALYDAGLMFPSHETHYNNIAPAVPSYANNAKHSPDTLTKGDNPFEVPEISIEEIPHRVAPQDTQQERSTADVIRGLKQELELEKKKIFSTTVSSSSPVITREPSSPLNHKQRDEFDSVCSSGTPVSERIPASQGAFSSVVDSLTDQMDLEDENQTGMAPLEGSEKESDLNRDASVKDGVRQMTAVFPRKNPPHPPPRSSDGNRHHHQTSCKVSRKGAGSKQKWNIHKVTFANPDSLRCSESDDSDQEDVEDEPCILQSEHHHQFHQAPYQHQLDDFTQKKPSYFPFTETEQQEVTETPGDRRFTRAPRQKQTRVDTNSPSQPTTI